MDRTLLISFAAFFLLMAALAAMRPRAVPGRAWQLFRVLLPSWKFFDEPGETPELFVRLEPAGRPMGPWENSLQKPERNWHALFFNPQGNYFLACHSLLEQLCQDANDWGADDPERLERSVSFALVKNLICFELRRTGRTLPPGPFRFQFKLATGTSDVLLSPVYDG